MPLFFMNKTIIATGVVLLVASAQATIQKEVKDIVCVTQCDAKDLNAPMVLAAEESTDEDDSFV